MSSIDEAMPVLLELGFTGLPVWPFGKAFAFAFASAASFRAAFEGFGAMVGHTAQKQFPQKVRLSQSASFGAGFVHCKNSQTAECFNVFCVAQASASFGLGLRGLGFRA